MFIFKEVMPVQVPNMPVPYSDPPQYEEFKLMDPYFSKIPY